jgi:hypothetical protein
MPRAVHKKDRLYTSEITALQRIIKLSAVDDRIPPKVKQHILASSVFLVTALSNAHAGKVDGEI